MSELLTLDREIHKMEQRSEEWYEVRRLRMTGSNAQAIASAGKGLQTYIKGLIGEHIAWVQGRELEQYDGPDMERGRELEDSARIAYEFETGQDVEEIGFFSLGDRIGCSPDGLVGSEGILEIKAKNDARHLDLLLTDNIDMKELWQCLFNALIMGRKWIDYVSYNPNFKRSLYIQRIDLSDFETMCGKIWNGLEVGEKLLEELLNHTNVIHEIQ